MTRCRIQKTIDPKHMSFAPFLPNREILCQTISINGSSHHLKLLKRPLLDPQYPALCQDSIKRQYKQALKTGTTLFSSNDKYTQKKRKLEQYVRGDKLKVSGMDLKKGTSYHTKKSVKEQSSVVSCRTNLTITARRSCMQHACDSSSLSSESNIHQAKQEPSKLSKRNNNESPSLSSENIRSIVSTVENIHLSHQDGAEALDVENANSTEDSELSRFEEQKCKRRPAFPLLMFKGEYLPRPEVPVGPRFQAEIPLMDVHTTRNNYMDEDASGNRRWLGSQIWPIEGCCSKKIPEDIGKGRLDYCSCELPGSPHCIRKHIAEAREFLAADLGPASLTWKFNETGQQVSSKWKLYDK